LKDWNENLNHNSISKQTSVLHSFFHALIADLFLQSLDYLSYSVHSNNVLRIEIIFPMVHLEKLRQKKKNGVAFIWGMDLPRRIPHFFPKVE